MLCSRVRALIARLAATVVVFGASGDLAKKKTLPALFHLFLAGSLPPQLSVLGVARSPLTDAAWRDALRPHLPADEPQARHRAASPPVVALRVSVPWTLSDVLCASAPRWLRFWSAARTAAWATTALATPATPPRAPPSRSTRRLQLRRRQRRALRRRAAAASSTSPHRRTCFRWRLPQWRRGCRPVALTQALAMAMCQQLRRRRRLHPAARSRHRSTLMLMRMCSCRRRGCGW